MIEVRVHPDVLYFLEGRQEVVDLRQPKGLKLFEIDHRDYGELRVFCDTAVPLPDSMDSELDRLIGLM